VFAYICLCLCGTTEKIGESWRFQQPNTEDPLLAAVDLLESNWKLVQNVLQLTGHVLIRMFVGFWPKNRKEMPGDNLRKLLKAFDTTEDLVLALKRTSMKRGIEGAIFLAQSHGEEVDWEKVGSSHAHPFSEMEEFFQKAKQYAPKFVSLISPSAASSISALRSSTTPSSTPAADAYAPPTAMEPAAEVA
jgi:hypothetical protein